LQLLRRSQLQRQATKLIEEQQSSGKQTQ